MDKVVVPEIREYVLKESGFSLALKKDGSIVGWGNYWYGQTTPPAGNNFISIATRAQHSLAISLNK